MSKQCYIRTLRVPIDKIVDDDRSAFYRDLRESIALATRTANKVLSLCMAIDCETLKLDKNGKLEKCSRVYTYPYFSAVNRKKQHQEDSASSAERFKALSEAAGSSEDWSGNTMVMAAITRQMEQKYLKARWAIFKGTQTLPTERNTPWVLRKQSIKRIGDTWRIKLSKKCYSVTLRRGSNYRRQHAVLDSMPTSALCDSRIRIDRRGKAILELAVETKKNTSKQRSGSITFYTDAEALLVCAKQQSDVPFTINADQLKNWQAERNRRMHRLRQDKKAGASRKTIAAKMDEVGRKYRNRLSTLTKTAANLAVAHADRRRVERVYLDMTNKSYVESFPWFQLKTEIANRCDALGIEFVDQTMVIKKVFINKPHVYFLYSNKAHQVKIGFTRRQNEKRKKDIESVSGMDTVLVAMENAPERKLKECETRWHARFASHRVCVGGRKTEWFHADPVLQCLRDSNWFGNAGNESQLRQVFPPSWFTTSETPPPVASTNGDNGSHRRGL